MTRLIGALALASAAFVLSSPVRAQDVPPSQAELQPVYEQGVVTWRTSRAHSLATVRIVGPDGLVIERRFDAGEPSLSLAALNLPDGVYAYEVRLSAAGPLQRRDAGQPGGASSAAAPGLARSGSFRVAGGAILVAGAVEPGMKAAPSSPRAARTDGIAKDQVIADDLIVQGSACVGLDCVANESFGFDTLRLKENNTRIKFEDTSSSAGFATHDWQLTANDSASGGAERFIIEDITAATQPFYVMGSAPTSSLVVSASGRIGLRTATPVLDVHMVTGNTPAVRFEQDGTGGFTPQTWDVAGNEANFFVRDVTGGSRLPLRIRPGAPTSSLDIAASGNVGIGTASPAVSMHVYRAGGTAELRVEEATSTVAARTLVSLHNQGDLAMRFTNVVDAASGGGWFVTSHANAGPLANAFTIGRYAYASPPIPSQPPASSQLTLDAAGNLIIAGTLTQGSSRTIKDNIVAVQPQRLLDAVLTLPVYTWTYKAGGADDRHLGPLAEDFYATFGLGRSDRSLAPADLASVAIGAAQALARTLSEREREIQALQARLDALERRLDAAVPVK